MLNLFNRTFNRRFVLAAAVSQAALAAVASAQIRMATYNIEADINNVTTPRAGMETVLEGMGSETVNGFARPLDILTLQETTSNTTTVQPLIDSLNAHYGAGVYAMSTYQATQSGTFTGGNGPNAIVYNTQTLQLIGSVGIFTPSSSGPPRQAVRYEFRPIGYNASADFFVDVSHFKSGSDTDSETRRNTEAQLLRGDAANLPAGSRLIYTGDMNLFKDSSEPAWVTLKSTGTGSLASNQGIDPINLGNGSWNSSNAAFSFGYSDSSTSLKFRDDLEANTAPTMDGHGFSYITGSYHAFGNNGTTPVGAAASSGANTALPGMPNRTAILSALTTASDHYPVLADYRLPAKMSASVASVPSQVIVGASVPITLSVANSAPVQVAIGADTLDYSFSGAGAVSGAGSFTGLAALSTANQHTLSLDASTLGTASGTVNVNSSSQEVANGSFSQAVSTQVIDHSQPSLAAAGSVNVATIDFGVRGRGLGGATSSFAIYNLVGNGATAGLDLDSVNGSGSTLQLTTNAGSFSNLAAGSHNNFTAALNASSNGTLSASYTFNVSDQNLPGATARGPLTLVLKGIVATPGDANLDGKVNFDDYARIDAGFNSGATDWFDGDFNSDGKVNFDDYALIDISFNNGGGSMARALAWLDGSNHTERGMNTAALQMVEQHYDEFGGAYAASVMRAVPEPGSVVIIGLLGVIGSTRRRRRTD